MDLGIDKLVDMFEERFGKRAATVLLFLIALAIAAWAVKEVHRDIVVPLWALLKGVYNYLETSNFGISRPIAVALTIRIGSGLIVGVIAAAAYFLLSRPISKRLRLLHQDVLDEIDRYRVNSKAILLEMNTDNEKLTVEGEALYSKLENARIIFNATADELKLVIAKLEAMGIKGEIIEEEIQKRFVGILKDIRTEVPSPPTLLDTEEKTPQ